MVSRLRNVLSGLVGRGSGSPPIEKSSKPSTCNELKATGPPEVLHKPCSAGDRSITGSDITIHVRVEAFSVPSK